MKIYIGEIFSNEIDLFAEDDICPSKMRNLLSGLEDGEEIELNITSPGGDVIGGNAIISQLRECQAKGHKVVAKVHGIAASMGSVIACAADELVLDSSAVFMMHYPWTMAMGNQNDLRKEADTLEMLSKTLIAIYKTKFPSKSEEQISDLMANETWILATEAGEYGLVCTIDNEANEPMRIAAKVMDKYMKNYKHPRGLTMKNEEKIEEEKKEEQVEETVEEQTEEKVEEPEEKEEPSEKEETELEKLTREIDELKKECEALKEKLAECEKPDEDEEKVTKAECEKRVYGMQQSMQKQVNEYVDKVKEFEVQIEAKDKELISYKNEIISLKDNLDKANGELSKMASALEEKNKALDMLNANVNSQPEEEELLTLKEVQAKYKGNPKKIAEIVRSGKFVRG